jgi:hypothetical protein
MENNTDPIKRKELYDYLKSESLTDLDFETFSTKYSSEEKSNEIYSYLKENKLTDLDSNKFYSEYFGDLNQELVEQPTQEPVKVDEVKKKETTTVTSSVESGVSDISNEVESLSSVSQTAIPKSQPLDFRPIEFDADFSESLVAKKYNEVISKTDQETKNSYQEFINLRNISDEERSTITESKSEITLDNRREKLGFLGSVENDLKNFSFSKIFGSDKNFEKERLKEIKELNRQRQQELDSGSAETAFTKRKKTEFLNDLDPEKRKKVLELVAIEEQVNQNIIFKANKTISKANKEFADIDLNIESLSNGLDEINKSIKDNPDLTIEDQQLFKEDFENKKIELESLVVQRQELAAQSQTVLDESMESENSLGTFEEEKELLKKTYDFATQTKATLSTGFAEIGSGLLYSGEKLFNVNIPVFNEETGKMETGDANTIRIREEALSRVATINEYRKNVLTEKISLDQVDGIADFGEFVKNTLLDTTPTLVQLSIPYVGQASFFASQQASAELATRQRTIDNQKDLNQINKDLLKENLPIQNRPALNKRKSQLESIQEPSETEIMAVSYASAGVELFLAQFGKIRNLKALKRTTLSIGKPKLQTAMVESFRKKTLNSGIEFGKGTIGEGGEELGITLFTNLTDKYVFGENFNEDGSKKSVLDNTWEATIGGMSAGGAMSGTASLTGIVGNIVGDRNSRKTIVKNVKETNTLLRKIEEVSESESTSEEDKTTIIQSYQSRIREINTENGKLIKRTFEAYDNLTVQDKKRVVEISEQASAIELTITNIKSAATNPLSKTELTLDSVSETVFLEQRLASLEAEKAKLIESAEVKTTITIDGQEEIITNSSDLYKKIADDNFVEGVANGTISIDIKNNEEASRVLSERVEDFKNPTQENTEGTDIVEQTQSESTDTQTAIAQASDSNQTYFDELENEEDAVTRLEGEIDPKKDRDEEVNRIAEEHTESYKAYLEENEDVENADSIEIFKDKVKRSLALPNNVPQDAKGTFLERIQKSQQEYVNPINKEKLVGDVFFDGNEIVFTDGKQEFSLGTVQDALQQKSLPITPTVIKFEVNQDGSFQYNGDSFEKGTITTQQKGLKSIKTDKDGNVKRVVVTHSNGDTISVKGEEAVELANGMLLDFALQKEGGLETKINTDEKAKRIVEQRVDEEIQRSSEIEANRDSERGLQGRNETRVDETQTQGDTTADADVRPTSDTDTEQGKDNAVQPTAEPTASQGEVEVNTSIDIAPKPIIRQRFGNDVLDVSLQDGKVVVTNSFNKEKKVSKQNEKAAIDAYVENNNFDNNEFTPQESSDNPSINSQEIAVNSTNPSEVASQIRIQQEAEQSGQVNTDEVSNEAKKNSIAETFKELRFKKVDKRDGTKGYEIVDLSQGFKGGNKKASTLGAIIEAAQRKLDENTQQETDAIDVQSTGFQGSDNVVSEDDVRGFVNEYTSGTDYINQAKSERKSESSEVSSLKDKFTELTGLESTDSNIDAVANVANQELDQVDQEVGEEMDELPFQVDGQNEIPQEVIDSQEVADQIRTLIPTNLADDVVILTDEQIVEFLKEIGYENVQAQADFVRTPNGFVYQGKVYINSDKVNSSTLVHEFGHLWNTYMKANHKAVYDKGLKLVEGTEYHDAVINNTAYDNLTPEQKLEEALAIAIGEKGVKILDEAKSGGFKEWFKVLFKRIAAGLRLSNIKPDKLADLNLKQFTDLAAAEILSGKDITGRETKASRDAAKRKDAATPNTTMQSVIEQEEAVRSTKQKLIEKTNEKNKTEKGVKKALQDYIDANLTKAQALQANDADTKKLVKIVADAKTDINGLKAIKEIDALIAKLDTKYNNNKTELQQARENAKKIEQGEKTDKKSRRIIIQKYLNEVIKGKWFSNITFNNIKSIESIIEQSTNENIDSALSAIDALAVDLETKYNESKSRNEEKKRIADEKIRDKTNSVRDTQKAVRDYIKDSFENRMFGFMKLSDFNSLIELTKFEGKKSKTKGDNRSLEQQQKAKLKEVLDKAEDIALGVENKRLRGKFILELSKGRSKKQSGRIVAGSIDYFTAERSIDTIEKLINGNFDFESKYEELFSKNGLAKKGKRGTEKQQNAKDIVNKLDELIDDILYTEREIPNSESGETELVAKIELTEKEAEDLKNLQVAKDFLDSLIKNNKYANKLINASLDYILELKAEGRSILKSKKAADKAILDQQRQEAYDAIDSKKQLGSKEIDKPLSNIKDNVSKSRSAIKISIQFLKGYSRGFYQNFRSISEAFKRTGDKGSALLGLDKVLAKYDLSENTRDSIIIEWNKEITEIKELAFGSFADSDINVIKKSLGFISRSKFKRAKADWALSAQENINRTYPDGTVDVTKFSVSTLLDVILKAKDPKNLIRLAKQGFDEKAINEINDKLSDEVKDYGNKIMEFYQSKYDQVNEVYKKIFYRDMPFDEFYSGKLNVDKPNSAKDFSQDLFSGIVSNGSVHSGSSKAKKEHDHAIIVQPVDMSTNQYINEMSRFIAYAEVEKEFNNIVKDETFEKLALLNIGLEGGMMIDYLKKFQKTEIYEDGKRSAAERVVNTITGSFAKYTLGAKLFNLPIQMMSALNGQSSLPNNLTAKEWLDAHKNIISEAAYLFKNSEFLKIRYSAEQMVKVLASVDTNRQLKDFQFLGDRSKMVTDILTEVYDQALDTGMYAIKAGDAMGIMGVVPVYTAAKARIRKENPNFTEQQVLDESMLVFENIANNTQQGQTKGSKTVVQRDAFARLLVSFGSTIILDMRESSLRYKDLKRHINKMASNNENIGVIYDKLGYDVNDFKHLEPSNTVGKNIRGFVNYGFSQPLFYALWGVVKISGVAAAPAAIYGAVQTLGYLMSGDDDELDKMSEEQKDIARVLLTGQLLDDPILGNAFKYYLDKEILRKEFTFGGIGNVFALQEIEKLESYFERRQNSKTPETKEKYTKLLITQMTGMGLGLPKHAMTIALFNEELHDENRGGFTASERARIYAGASFFGVDKVREERTGVTLQKIIERNLDQDYKDDFYKENPRKSSSNNLPPLPSTSMNKLPSLPK